MNEETEMVREENNQCSCVLKMFKDDDRINSKLLDIFNALVDNDDLSTDIRLNELPEGTLRPEIKALLTNEYLSDKSTTKELVFQNIRIALNKIVTDNEVFINTELNGISESIREMAGKNKFRDIIDYDGMDFYKSVCLPNVELMDRLFNTVDGESDLEIFLSNSFNSINNVERYFNTIDNIDSKLLDQSKDIKLLERMSLLTYDVNGAFFDNIYDILKDERISINDELEPSKEERSNILFNNLYPELSDKGKRFCYLVEYVPIHARKLDDLEACTVDDKVTDALNNVLSLFYGIFNKNHFKVMSKLVEELQYGGSINERDIKILYSNIIVYTLLLDKILKIIKFIKAKINTINFIRNKLEELLSNTVEQANYVKSLLVH